MGGDYIEGMYMCLPQVIKSFQNYRAVATTFYPTLVYYKSQLIIHILISNHYNVINGNTKYKHVDITTFGICILI